MSICKAGLSQDQTMGSRQVKTPLGISCFLDLLGLRAYLAADTPFGWGGKASRGMRPQAVLDDAPTPAGVLPPLWLYPHRVRWGRPPLWVRPPLWALRNTSGMSEPPGFLP